MDDVFCDIVDLIARINLLFAYNKPNDCHQVSILRYLHGFYTLLSAWDEYVDEWDETVYHKMKIMLLFRYFVLVNFCFISWCYDE